MRTKPYPSDLTDAQWEILKPLLPPASHLGRPRKTDLRDILDAIFYRNRNGCTGRALPHDFPTWRTVYHSFIRWTAAGTWRAINDALREQVRRKAGREPTLALMRGPSRLVAVPAQLPDENASHIRASP
jgi:putative transposase